MLKCFKVVLHNVIDVIDNWWEALPAKCPKFDMSVPGMIVACLVKEVQLTAELQRMSEIGLVPAETVQVSGIAAF